VEADTLSIPLDLSEWVTVPQLRKWIVQDVEKLNWSNPELIDLLSKDPDFEPMEFLCTTTLAYATGVFSAEEIVRLCSEEIEFRPIRPKLPPLADDFLTFRKQNRGLLKWTLVQVLTRALKSQLIEGDQLDILPPGLRRYLVENAIERLDIARHMDRPGEA
jgi:hypothetical protein